MGKRIEIERNNFWGLELKKEKFLILINLYLQNIWCNIDNKYIGVNIILIVIIKIMKILEIKKYFWLVIILKKIMNFVIKLFMFGNVREVIDKIVNIVNIFGMEIVILFILLR